MSPLRLGLQPRNPGGLSNFIRNTSNDGVVAGVIGSGGAFPTQWSRTSAAGLTTTIAGTGAASGQPYVQFRVNGTTSDTNGFMLNLEGTQIIPALTGQVWRLSCWIAMTAGSMTNVTVARLQAAERTSAGAFIVGTNGSDFKASLGATFTQFTADLTLAGGVTTAFIQPRLSLSIGTGLAIDFTLRVGMPFLTRVS